MILQSWRVIGVKERINRWSRLRLMILPSWSVLGVNERASRWSRLRLMILIPLAVFLLWEVITRSLAAYLADARPELALRLRSTNPTALLNLAQDTLNLDLAANEVGHIVPPPRNEASPGASDPKEIQSLQNLDLADGAQPSFAPGRAPLSAGTHSQSTAQIRSWAELALLNDPLNARAFRILGQLSQRTSDDEQTETLMRAAVRRSLLESVAVYWMMRKSYEDRDYPAAIRYADTLLRTRPHDPQLPMPLLGRIVETPDAISQLKELLASNPPWREQFFMSLPYSISDARTPLNILLSLKDTPTPPAPAEFRPYLAFLIAGGFYELAYYTWLQLMPTEQLSEAGRLFNGNFELASSGLPFDWVFTKGSGVTIEIARRPGSEGGHALFVEFGYGRVDHFGVTQLIVLPPGGYQFRGKSKIDIVSQRGLRWRITCARQPDTPIGDSQTVNGADSAWKDFEFSFTVPSAGCPAQYVQLALDARSASEQFISGSVWYDDLAIVREPSVKPY
jgi:hypothetical protein